MIYGASGYTGARIPREAVRRGHRPLLAGRCAHELEPLARELKLRCIQLELRDEAKLARSVRGLQLVLHAAGPFVHTYEPMLRVCLEEGVHYTDIAGELPVLRGIYAQHERARERQIALAPGLGLDTVPGDCLARYVAERTPGAVRLELGLSPLLKTCPGSVKCGF